MNSINTLHNSSMGKISLVGAGAMSLFIAILHFAMVLVGAPAYDYFRAGPEMVELAQSGSLIPGSVTLGITLAFLVFSLYAFAGAGWLPALPFVRPAIMGIGLLFTLRGLAIFLQIPGLVPESEVRDIVFSGVSLLAGILYLTGRFTVIRKGSDG